MKSIKLPFNVLLAALVAFATMWLTPRANAQVVTNLIVNGTFDSPPIPVAQNPQYDVLLPGSTYLTGWTVDIGQPDTDGIQRFNPSVGVTPINGTPTVQLTGGATYSAAGGGVSQTIPTSPGTIYTISLDIAARSSTPGFGTFIFGNTNFALSAPSTTSFTNVTFQAVATSGNTLIDIYMTNGSGSKQIIIDNVVVAPPPSQSSNYWGGFTVDGNWDNATTNWGFGQSFSFLLANGFTSVYFSDTNNLATTLNPNVVIQASGVSIGTVNFVNNTVNYNLSDAGGSTTGITGAAAVSKFGTGGVTFSGAQTYTGPTTVNAGTLTLGAGGSISNSTIINLASGTTLNASAAGTLYLGASQTLISAGNAPTNSVVNGDVDASAGGIILPSGAGAPGKISFGNNLTLGTRTMTVDITIANSNTDLIAVAGNLTNNGTVTIKVNPIGGVLPAGTYTLFTYAAHFGSGTFVLDSATPRNNTLNVTPTAVTITVVGAPGSLVWQGDGVANNWDIQGTANWLIGATPAVFFQGDNVSFDGTGSSTPAVNLTTTLNPSTITVGAAQNYTIGGPGKISGIGRLTQNGPGTLILDNVGSNDFTGGVTISGGLLQVGANDANKGNLPSGNITNNAAIIFAGTGTNFAAGNISGTGSITNSGSGTAVLSGTSTYSGVTVINAGTLQVNTSAGASTNNIYVNNTILALSEGGGNTFNNLILGTGTINIIGTGSGPFAQVNRPMDGFTGVLNVGYNGIGRFVDRALNNSLGVGITVNITNGGQLYLQGAANTFGTINAAGPGDGDGSGTFHMDASTAIIGGPLNLFSDVSFNGTVSITNVIQDGGQAYGISNIGGNVKLFATNTYSGKTRIAGGTLTLGLTGSISNSPVILMTGGTFDVSAQAAVSGNWSVYPGKTLEGNGTVSAGVNNNVVYPAGTIIAPGTNGSAGTLSFANGLTLNGQAIQFDLTTNTTSGNDVIKVGTGGNFESLTLNSDSSISLNFLNGSLGAGSYILLTYPSKIGPGTFTLAQAYPNVTLLVGSTATIINVGNGGATINWQGDFALNNWDFTTPNWLAGATPVDFVTSNNVVFPDGGSTFPDVNLTTILEPSSIIMNSGQTYTFSGSGSLTGAMNLTLLGNGTTVINSSNNFSGGTFVYFGELDLGNGGTNGKLGGTINDFSTVVLNHSGNVGNTNLVSSAFTGNGTLTVNGSVMEVLTGNSTISGGTTINGKAQLNRASAAGTGPVFINGGVLNVLAGGFTFPNVFRNTGTINVVPNVASPSASVDFAQFSATMNNLNNGTIINVPVGPGVARFETVSGNGTLGVLTINVTNKGQLYMVSGTIAGTVNIAGPGYGDAFGALRIDSGATLTGPLTLTGDAAIGSSTSPGNINGFFDDGGHAYSVIISAGTINYNGTLVNYHGNTTISNNATLFLTNGVVLHNSPVISIGTNATFNVASNGGTYLIPSGIGGDATVQKLAGTSQNGKIFGSVTLGAGGSLGVTLANDGKPSLIVTNGVFTINNNPVIVTASALPFTAGIYPLINATTNGTNGFGAGTVVGSVATSPLSFAGAGLASDASASLVISNSSLYLFVSQPAPSPATFSSASALPNNGGFQLIFSGTSGHNYSLRASTNIATPYTNWTVLKTGFFTAQPVTNVDTAMTNNSKRFYLIFTQ